VINCRQLIEFLSDYLEGNLSAAERRRFEEHLAVCDSCVAYLHTYEVTIRMEKAAAIEECEVPEELVRAVVASRGL
jgi:predicted anti-sigma-YlaC factor YlaD